MDTTKVQKICPLSKQTIQHSISTAFLVFCFIFTLLSFFSLFSCAEQKMSLKEAKQVTVSMSKRSFVPPPRSINDIMTILEDVGKPDAESIKAITALKARAAEKPPEGSNKITLAKFYQKRATAKFDLGLNREGIQDLRESYHLMKESGSLDRVIEGVYGIWEAWSGDINKGIKVLEEHVKRSDALAQAFGNLLYAYSKSGNLKALEEIKKSKRFAFSGNSPYLKWNKARNEAIYLEALGKYEEAEPYLREGLELLQKYEANRGYITQEFYDQNLLIRNLVKQEKFVEAELEARKGIKASLAIGGSSSIVTAVLIEGLCEILIRQGRLEDAIKLCEANIRIWQHADFPIDSWPLAKARVQLGVALSAQGNFKRAMDQFKLAKDGLTDNTTIFAIRAKRDPQVILSQLMTDYVDDALKTAEWEYELFRDYLGESNYQAAEMLAFRGMANIRKDNLEQAIADFSSAVPMMMSNNQKRKDYLSSQRLKYVLDDYINALFEIHNSPLEKRLKINAAEEIFKLAEAGTRSTVEGALGASSARAAAVAPELADLVRKEQDALQQIRALQETLTNALSLSPDDQNPDALNNLKATMEILSTARATLLKEINHRFPKYKDYTDPIPVEFATVQNHLLPGEALIVIYSTASRVYVWAVAPDGKTQFAIVELGKKDLQNMVDRIRKTLAPRPIAFKDIPEFDLASACELYSRLLKSVESGWKGAKNLIIIAPGILSQLPFSVLPFTSVKLGYENNLLFANYRKVPWLIRKTSLTRLPSVSSFIALRSVPTGDPDRKPFAGFGDPFFSRTQLAKAQKESSEASLGHPELEGQLKVRGIRVTGEGNLDNYKIWSSQLTMLDRLPDTADEILSIARTMGVDSEQDIFLGKRASEHQVKKMNLSDRRVIAFASHGLVQGDLDGLDEPAIALSAPEVTGDNEDGLLTMSEVLKLKLNADWIVLSACNTGAADGAGAEAVSGLGRAFFYAGSRALLVSMWPVETTSAKKITTGIFRFQKEIPELSRANALRKSILHLIDKQVLKEDTSGKTVASYAHPFFWAPFIVVGDGR
jgi:CHAT domain-containing protein